MVRMVLAGKFTVPSVTVVTEFGFNVPVQV
ncbi:hypothetical protein HRbin21_01127 [bacterium HR21]|nr:hypothetical protein HRbin21_01127 [bacterium HR21]